MKLLKTLVKKKISLLWVIWGLLPQSAKNFKFKGKQNYEREKNFKRSKNYLKLQVFFSMVLECIESSLAKKYHKSNQNPNNWA